MRPLGEAEFILHDGHLWLNLGPEGMSLFLRSGRRIFGISIYPAQVFSRSQSGTIVAVSIWENIRDHSRFMVIQNMLYNIWQTLGRRSFVRGNGMARPILQASERGQGIDLNQYIGPLGIITSEQRASLNAVKLAQIEKLGDDAHWFQLWENPLLGQ